MTTDHPRKLGIAKHEIIRDSILETIRRGEFQVGYRLPADRELAARFGVSYMTVRRAVSELVEADLLERRIGDGTYVRDHSRQRLSYVTVNLICSAYGGMMQNDFLNIAAQLAEKRGWRHHSIRVHPHHGREAVRALESGDMALLLLDDSELIGPLGKALVRAGSRAVLLGNRLDDQGVTSILADDDKAIRLAIEHLRGFGHSEIALLANHPDGHNESIQINAWRSSFPQRSECKIQERLVAANTPRFECATQYSYERMLDWLDKGGKDVTAIITLDDELAIGALAACRDMGREVPDEISIVNITASSRMFYVHPPLTCIDVCLPEHIECAIQALDDARNGKVAQRLCLIEPQLIARQSVASPQASYRQLPAMEYAGT